MTIWCYRAGPLSSTSRNLLPTNDCSRLPEAGDEEMQRPPKQAMNASRLLLLGFAEPGSKKGTQKTFERSNSIADRTTLAAPPERLFDNAQCVGFFRPIYNGDPPRANQCRAQTMPCPPTADLVLGQELQWDNCKVSSAVLGSTTLRLRLVRSK